MSKPPLREKAARGKGELAGTIMEDTVTEYEEALTQYKKVGKTAKKSMQ